MAEQNNNVFPEILNPIQAALPNIPIPPALVNPGNQILTIRLSEGNYLLWRQQVITAARGYGLTHILLQGTPPPAMIEGQQNPIYDQWIQQDQLLASWLLASISEPILITTVGLESAHQI